MSTMWTNLPRIGFDTETTGRDPKEARLVTCSLVIQFPDNTQKKHYWLADPGVEIPPETTAIHGITTEQARSQGRHIDEVLEEIAIMLAEHMQQGFPVVAYNAAYDLTLLEHELERHNLPTLTHRLGGEIFPVIDPYFLDRWGDKYRKASGKRKLVHLVEHYGCEASNNFHNAEEDVLATLRLLDAMLQNDHLIRQIQRIYGINGGLAGMSLRDIQSAAAKAHSDLVFFIREKYPERTTEEPVWPIY